MEVGLCHPPVGLNLYVASMIAGMRITDPRHGGDARGCSPMLVFLVIVTYWPAADAVSSASARDAIRDFLNALAWPSWFADARRRRGSSP